ncbi:MAG: hypothetical protein R3B93_14365 [Bacteroidia bacterium]
MMIIISHAVFSQIGRGNLLNGEIPASIDSFFVGKQINLVVLRNSTAFLTDRDITSYLGYDIPNRKKAFMRHVKHLSEKLECAYQDHQEMNAEMAEIVYEISLLEASLKQKAVEQAQTKIPLKAKVGMIMDSYKSRYFTSYKIPPYVSLENDHDLPSISDSPYFHHVEVDTASPLHKQFGYLAKWKKVDAEKDMVVLFEELSLSGSAPKIRTLDLDLDNEWSLKWGDEVHADVVGSRIFAALGYDVDHPYFYEKDKLTLIFDENAEIKNAEELVQNILQIYDIDLDPFLSGFGLVTEEMAAENKDLESFVGSQYVRFVKCAVEARPDRVKRLGSFLPHLPENENRPELKGALLAHHFIGNWDTREANTLLTTVHNGDYAYRISAVFSDLGTSMGVVYKAVAADFKVGLVNELPWEVVRRKGKKLKFTNSINAILPSYKNAEYEDLLWMAQKIAMLNEENLRKMIEKGGWPKPIEKLYFHKMASRRASIIDAFQIDDPHPIAFDKKLTIYEEGRAVVKNGVLVVDYQREMNPESFLKKKGRMRNYGN